MTVTGEYGRDKQITIVYPDKNGFKGERTIMINSNGN